MHKKFYFYEDEYYAIFEHVVLGKPICLEIDVSSVRQECESDYGRWRGWDMIAAEGRTLEEALETATITMIDQDGGNAGELNAQESWMENIIKEEWTREAEKVIFGDLEA